MDSRKIILNLCLTRLIRLTLSTCTTLLFCAACGVWVALLVRTIMRLCIVVHSSLLNLMHFLPLIFYNAPLFCPTMHICPLVYLVHVLGQKSFVARLGYGSVLTKISRNQE